MAIVSAEKFVQTARDNGYAVSGFTYKTTLVDSSYLAQQKLKKLSFNQTSMGVNTWVVTKLLTLIALC